LQEKIDKGSEVFKDVKVPAFVGTREKAFCSDEHANNYVNELSKKPKSGGGGCCG